MVSYYISLLLLTLVLQTTKTDVIRTSIAILLVTVDSFIIQGYMNYGYSLFESVVRCDILYLIVLTFTTPFHKSKMLLFVVVISLLWNTLCTLPTPIYLQDFIYSSYETLNIILFECLLYSCANTTRVSIFMKMYLNDMIARRSLCRKGEEPLC